MAPDHDRHEQGRSGSDGMRPTRMRPEARPPRWAEALLARVLPAGDVRESVLGDLHELFVARVREGQGGFRASLWYCRRALSVGAGYALRRGLRRRGPGTAHERSFGWGASARALGLASDLRISARSLARRPTFTLGVLGILAVGMTAATAIFSVVDSIVFKPLDLPDAHRIVTLCEDHARLAGFCVASPANTEDLRSASTTLSELGWGRGWGFRLTDEQGSEGIRGVIATASYFRALGVVPAAGRLFADDEVGAERDGVVLLSHAFWTTRYGRDAGVVGSTLRLDGEPFTVVGVLPEGFDDPFVSGVELWKPPHVDAADPESRGWRGFQAIGLLAPGVSLAAAEAELGERYRALASTHPEIDDEWRLRVVSLKRIIVGDSRVVLLAFLGGAALLLGIVCANVANLLLARGIARKSELAMRAALGASRGRLVGLMVVESLVVTVAAALLALLLARGASAVLLSLAPADIPRLGEVAVGGRVLLFAALASLFVTALFALAPALRVTSGNVGLSLRSAAREGEERGSSRLRGGLLVAELALSMVLLTSAGLLTRSFTRYLAWEPGFDPDRLFAVSVFVDLAAHPTRAEFTSVLRSAEERIATLPGVLDVATASAGPLFGGGDGATPFETDDRASADAPGSVWWFDVGPRYFATLGVPVVQGREFTEADGPGADSVAVVNESFARIAWADTRAVGRTVRLPEQGLTLRVVGVVADVPPLSPGQATHPEIYWSNRQVGRAASFLLVRSSVDPTTLASAVTEALLEVDPGFSLGTPFSLGAARDRALVRPRFQALVMTALALVALALASAGVYALVSYAAARRRRELGIRRALGASSARVVSLMVTSSLALALLGVGLGVVGALGSARLLQGMIPGVSSSDLPSLLGAGGVLLASAALAAAIPAMRASRADPLTAMRD